MRRVGVGWFGGRIQSAAIKGGWARVTAGGMWSRGSRILNFGSETNRSSRGSSWNPLFFLFSCVEFCCCLPGRLTSGVEPFYNAAALAVIINLDSCTCVRAWSTTGSTCCQSSTCSPCLQGQHFTDSPSDCELWVSLSVHARCLSTSVLVALVQTYSACISLSGKIVKAWLGRNAGVRRARTTSEVTGHP